MHGARERYSIDVTVLRLLNVERTGSGFRTTYVAEVDRPVPALPWGDRLDDHPLRMPWARPGGPKADIKWAKRTLARHGLSLSGPPEQMRTWNLSSLWRLPVGAETFWLKTVPPFFEHEAAVLERLQGGPMPSLLAHRGHRLLMLDIGGLDLHEPTHEQRLRMIDQLVELQRAWAGRLAELIGLGLPDWRAPALCEAISDVVVRVERLLDPCPRRSLRAFVDGLPDRFAEIAACGLPDSLVHGDFHPGNHRGTDSMVVLLDWGDSGVGHPLLDQTAFLEHVPTQDHAAVQDHWSARWREAAPHSDPQRATELLAPIASARQAVIYQKFLDAIEPSERVYHANDPVAWLTRTARLVAA